MTGRSVRHGSHVIVMAKAPVVGRVKTRLCPPCTPTQAAAVAEAALADTLDAVSRCGAGRRILALDGEPGPWLPAGFEVVAQRGATFVDRLTAAWADAGTPGIQIGMDTPQVGPGDLDRALATLDVVGTDAVLGPANDGGWWCIGLRRPAPVFTGVPMSTGSTGRRQRARLIELGLRVADLDTFTDVDTFTDAMTVAADAPGTRFAVAVRGVVSDLAGSPHP